MKSLIRKILVENIEKAANYIADKIVKKLEIKLDKRYYNSASEMIEDFNDVTFDYMNNNWKKYFVLLNPDDDDDSPEYRLIKYPKSSTYDTDEMEFEMFYNFIDKLKNEGFITEDEEDNDVVIRNFIDFIYDKKVIKFQINEINGDLKINLRGMYAYNTIMEIIEGYGIDKNEELAGVTSELIIKKILDKLESMGVREKYGMIKFKEKM